MAIKTILFNTEMVKAILAENKTMTRRVLNPQPVGTLRRGYFSDMPNAWVDDVYYPHKPKYNVGDILWVRETWRATGELKNPYAYRADESELILVGEDGRIMKLKYRWRPSIHMPKAAARIFFRVTDVRVERLQDMTEEDVVAEGAEKLITCQRQRGIIEPDGALGDMCYNSVYACKDCDEINGSYPEKFGAKVWNPIYAKSGYGWDNNPWVWVYTFERVGKPEGWCKNDQRRSNQNR